jgi:D-mannonate dehydratase
MLFVEVQIMYNVYNFMTPTTDKVSANLFLRGSFGEPILNFDNKSVRNFALKEGVVIPRFYFN